MAILGLLDTETFSTERFKNVRRAVFYFYPNGAATLTGLLSLMSEESTNDPEFSWYEKRFAEIRTISAVISSTICLYKTVVGGVSGTWTIADGNLTVTAATSSAATIYGIKVASGGADRFRPGHVIRFIGIDSSAGEQEIIGVVETADTTNHRLSFRAIKGTTTALDYDLAANTGIEILAVGSSFSEGSLDISSENYTLPINPGNYTQIFRTPFSMTGTALKTAAKFDETGVYKDKAKEHSVNHNVELEKNFIFGEKNIYTGGDLPQRSMGGLLWHMRAWEAGTNYGVTAATTNSDDNKRIIYLSDGQLSLKSYSSYLERLFRVTNNKTNEKLVLCGSGFLNAINLMYEGRAQLTTDMNMSDTYGMDVMKHRTPFGTIYYKTHPLFSLNPVLRYNALFLDIQNLKYRYLDGRDTELLKNRQPNDADYRKDEWLTECGLEVRFPESGMYIQNLVNAY